MFLSFLLCQRSTVIAVNPNISRPAQYYLDRIQTFNVVESFDAWNGYVDYLSTVRAEAREKRLCRKEI